MKLKLLPLLLISFLFSFSAQSQVPSTTEYNPELETTWDANWITHPAIKGSEFGVYLFKKTFQLNDKPESFSIQRYQCRIFCYPG